jgi:two-component system cell cycle response regulator DivK
LIVEDNQANRELLSDWLESQGFEVALAENLEQGQRFFKTAAPDAVRLDVQLGREDSLSLAKWIKEHQTPCHIPVIAVTAHAMITKQQRVVQAGATPASPSP